MGLNRPAPSGRALGSGRQGTAGAPVYKLLGGKVGIQVRTYRTFYHEISVQHSVADYAGQQARKRSRADTPCSSCVRFSFGDGGGRAGLFLWRSHKGAPYPYPNRGLVTGRIRPCGRSDLAAKEALGPGSRTGCGCWSPAIYAYDALRFARALEPLHLLWVEDMITGDYSPFVNADVYRDVTHATTTPIHTGGEIYLRRTSGLIENHAVNVIGPDPCDVGGIAELKWIAGTPDLHGIAIAPHGTANGVSDWPVLFRWPPVCGQPHRFRISAGSSKQRDSGTTSWTASTTNQWSGGLIDVPDRPGHRSQFHSERRKLTCARRMRTSSTESGARSFQVRLHGRCRL
ncbi:MAG: enolase C-terminal domain-like protein [Thermomicrobiales bacterium]